MRFLFKILLFYIFLFLLKLTKTEFLRNDFLKFQRTHENPIWKKIDTASKDQNHTVIFAVQPLNVDLLEARVINVSNPESSYYGKYLQFEEVSNITSNAKGIIALKQFLRENGVAVKIVTPCGNFLAADSSILLWENMLHTKFYVYQHLSEMKTKIVRAEKFHLHRSISPYVIGVFKVVEFPTPNRPNRYILRNDEEFQENEESMTPQKLRSFYHIPDHSPVVGNQSVYSTSGQYFSKADLTSFANHFRTSAPLVEDVDNRNNDRKCVENILNCDESNLDLQYITAIAANIDTSIIYDTEEDGFLSWILKTSNMPHPPLVQSISYCLDERWLQDSDFAIMTLFNVQAMKLALMGVTLIAASGDDGVAGYSARGSVEACGYFPQFPASSPYVTAVGATMGAEAGRREGVCDAAKGGFITSGGGFSHTPRPSYQTTAVRDYLARTGAGGASEGAEFSADGRGYPDLALAGRNYITVIGGQIYYMSGTSASTPAFAGMVSLVNSRRISAGKPPLGFLNPAIYLFHDSFTNDVTTGNNRCVLGGQPCCSQGFEATIGWDPVTGFGSVDFQRFSDTMMSL